MTNGNKNTLKLEVALKEPQVALAKLQNLALTQQEAAAVLIQESILAEDFIKIEDDLPSHAPEITEIFGSQHVMSALCDAYYYMENFEIEWETYYLILQTLLKVYKPEELIINPDYIHCFIAELKNVTKKERNLVAEDDIESIISIYENALNPLCYKDIREMSISTSAIEESDDSEDEE